MNRSNSNLDVKVQALIDSWQPDYSLAADFYTSNEVYRTDLERIFFSHWMYAGHTSQIPEAGCYLLMDFAGESIIVVRDRQNKVHALANVCRHRGSRICIEQYGKLKAFVCPYHAWTYELDGQLRSRRAMPADFDPAQHGLIALRAEIFHGLIFITLNPNAPGLKDSLRALDAAFEIYDLENTRVASQRSYGVEANWKLAIENFMECYHCAPAHKEYSYIHALKSPRDNAALRPAMLDKAAGLGYCAESIDYSQPASADEVQHYYVRNALYAPNLTGSRDGQPIAPLLGKITGYDGGAADIQVGPVFYGILYADHAVLYRFRPLAVQRTAMDIIWLVNASAEEGKDYDIENLTWLWHITTEADEKIIAANQKGVNSRFYQPGPLSEMEDFTAGFIHWYLAQIRH